MDKLNPINYFAETDYRNKHVKFGIKASDRSRHLYVIGKTGMGKSTMLENMAIQDIQNGEGLAFIDPHGGTAEKLLEYIPEERIQDVVYFAPFDLDYPIAFNVMEDVGKDKRHLVVNGLMSVFKKIWVDAWSARMEYILNNTLLALLEYPDATLLSVNRMFADKAYRKKVVENVTDPSVKAFWVDEFAKYSDKFATEATAAIQNKVGQFISNPLIRNIIGQPRSSFDMRKVLDDKKILIVNLSKGRMGEQNASLIGSMLITKIYLSAMSRADLLEHQLARLPNFYFYVDEFQSFANESFADILSEARKYKLNLTIAHQYVEQMPEEVRAAVFGNVGTMAVFRVGSFDAEIFEKEFGEVFTSEDIVSLGFAQIYLRLMIDGVGSHPFSAKTLPPIPRPPVSYKTNIIDYTRKQYARPRELVEAEIEQWHLAKEIPPRSVAEKLPEQHVPLKQAPPPVMMSAGSNKEAHDIPPVRRSPSPPFFERRKTDISPQAAKPLASDVIPSVGMAVRRNSSPLSRGIPPPTPLMPPHPARPVFRAAPTMKHTNQETASPIEHLPRLPKYPLPPLAVKKQSVPLVSPHPMHPMEKKTSFHLSSLKNGFGHKSQLDKSASPENLKGLREALASALHKDVDALKKEEKNKTPTPDTKQRSAGKEVPEDVLKKILHTDAE
ncbi:MAG: type IV secretion system DNA-binding domain-containing protein [Candidatus Lloydbacteria bacterium]|nr:type IV secretion system DNA-binding domain-containing protein [Candidatus Lloydbacteria bacterium]